MNVDFPFDPVNRLSIGKLTSPRNCTGVQKAKTKVEPIAETYTARNQGALNFVRATVRQASEGTTSIMTSCPRLWDLEHSDCQVGTVDVLSPLPNL